MALVIGSPCLSQTLADDAMAALARHYSDPTLSAVDNVFVFQTLVNCLPEELLDQIAGANGEAEIAAAISQAPAEAVTCIFDSGPQQ